MAGPCVYFDSVRIFVGGNMKVGDLVRHKVLGKISFVTWAGRYGAHFKVWGFPVNCVFTSEAWEIVNESR